MKTKIVLDANFLMVPAQFKLDIFEEIRRIMNEPYDLITMSPVAGELQKIASGKSKDAGTARVALELIKIHNVKVIDASGRADAAIMKICDRNTVVCTQDKRLQNALKKKGVRILAMRKKSHLAFV